MSPEAASAFCCLGWVGGGSSSVIEISHLDATSSLSLPLPEDPGTPVSNAVPQDGLWVLCQHIADWAALSQSDDFTACRGVAVRRQEEQVTGLLASPCLQCLGGAKLGRPGLGICRKCQMRRALHACPLYSPRVPECSLGCREAGLSTFPFLSMLLCSFLTEF